MVKYRLLLLIIGLSELGWAMLVPPPLPSFPPCCYSEMENERRIFLFFFKREMRRERKNTPGSAAAAVTLALPGSDRREGVKVKVKAARGGTALW